MRRTLVALPVVSAIVLGVAGLGAGSTSGKASPSHGAGGRPVCSQAPLTFTEPIVLGKGKGYEPSVEVDSIGTIFVTAHKQSVVAEGTRTASWLWRSSDGGKSFEDMTGSLLDATDRRYALEGDLAIDAKDQLYFVDTWAADNHIYVWSDHGETLDFTRPVIASAEVDDRPWLAAHGDGMLYYLSNTGMRPDGRLTIHRSENGGGSFDLQGFTFPDSGWGFIDADPNGPHVYGVFNDLFYGTGLLGDALAVYAWHSGDRGLTWERTKVADLAHEYNGDGYPTVAVSPFDGSVWALWLDGDRSMQLANSRDRGATWSVRDITPFEGTYGYAWLDISAKGDLAVTFSARAADLGETDRDQRPYAMLVEVGSSCLTRATDVTSGCREPVSGRYTALQIETAGDQGDFFQLAFGPDRRVNVAWSDRDNGTVIKFARQKSGDNLSGRRICGFSGSLLPGARVEAHPRPDLFEDR